MTLQLLFTHINLFFLHQVCPVADINPEVGFISPFLFPNVSQRCNTNICPLDGGRVFVCLLGSFHPQNTVYRAVDIEVNKMCDGAKKVPLSCYSDGKTIHGWAYCVFSFRGWWGRLFWGLAFPWWTWREKQVTGSYFRTKPKQQLSPPAFSHLSPLSTSERAEMEWTEAGDGGRRRQNRREGRRVVETQKHCRCVGIWISSYRQWRRDQRTSSRPSEVLGSF